MEAQSDPPFVPLGRLPEVASAPPRLAPPGTPSSWVIAFAPIALFALDVWVAAVLGGYITWSIVLSVAALGLASTYLAARDDQRRLASRGYLARTSPLLAVVCPAAYLFVRGNRAFRESYAGFGPAWIHLATLALIVITANFLLPLMVRLNQIHV